MFVDLLCVEFTAPFNNETLIVDCYYFLSGIYSKISFIGTPNNLHKDSSTSNVIPSPSPLDNLSAVLYAIFAFLIRSVAFHPFFFNNSGTFILTTSHAPHRDDRVLLSHVLDKRPYNQYDLVNRVTTL